MPRPVYKVGRLRLDPGTRRVYELNRRFKEGKREITVTPQEFDLLAVLMRRPGMAFNVDVLHEQIGSGSEDPQNLLQRVICSIRHKIPAGAAKIETLWGASAYRIVPLFFVFMRASTIVLALTLGACDAPQAKPLPQPSGATLLELLVGPGECMEYMGPRPPGSPPHYAPRYTRCVSSQGMAVTCVRGRCRVEGRDI